MRWFNRRKSRDLIADSNRDWEEQRAFERIAQTRAGMLTIPDVSGVSAQEFQDQMLIAAGGWCAPSTPSFLQVPNVGIYDK